MAKVDDWQLGQVQVLDVDGVDTGMSAYERICCIINFLEQDVAEQAGKEAYGYLIVED